MKQNQNNQPDPYQIIGVKKNAEWDEIDQAYNKAKQEIEKIPNDKEKTLKLHQLNSAKLSMYKTLLDEKLKDSIVDLTLKRDQLSKEYKLAKQQHHPETSLYKGENFDKIAYLIVLLESIQLKMRAHNVIDSLLQIKIAFEQTKAGYHHSNSFFRYLNETLDNLGAPEHFKKKTATDNIIDNAGKKFKNIPPLSS